MSRFTNNLDQIRVAAPCHVDWDSMYGNERIRFCGQCQLNVYNLSELTRAEAEALISRTEGRLCVRYYQRSDGSIITRNCPIGLKAIKRRVSRIATAVASAVLSFLAGLGAYGIADRFSLVSSTPVTMMGEIAIQKPMRPPPPGINKTKVASNCRVTLKLLEGCCLRNLPIVRTGCEVVEIGKRAETNKLLV